MNITLLHGDCREQLQLLIDQGIQVDSIVTDPPYEMGFMNKSWDGTGIANDVDMWKLCLQALKPGGHLLSFGGTRTYHRMTCAIEDAGFEIRDCVNWIYGSGFPKSHDVSKAIDKMAGAEREITREGKTKSFEFSGKFDQASSDLRERRDTPSTEAAKQWSGFGTALKPAHEPIVLARKPLTEKNIASNVLKHGVGGINIDGCRVDGLAPERLNPLLGVKERINYGFGTGIGRSSKMSDGSKGRFPANIIHDGSDEVISAFPQSSQGSGGRKETSTTKGFSTVGNGPSDIGAFVPHADAGVGSASRFFYCAKASKKERNLGCEGLPGKETYTESTMTPQRDHNKQVLKSNHHPTVKPISLMKYLCRLITPPGGTVLDPFLGSGSTGIAAKAEGFSFIGIEKEADYMEIAKARIGGLNES